MKAWGKTDIGLLRRENQDALSIDLSPEENLAVCVVCDGMGGANAGGVASILAAHSFAEEMRNGHTPSMDMNDLTDLVRRASDRANREVWEHALSHPECEGMGTTLVAAVVRGRSAILANVGDSRAYLMSREGIQRLTRDHSIVEDLVYNGTLSREQARRHPEKNVITRAIGTEEVCECDIYRRELREGEILLLCSDGLSNMVEEQELLYEGCLNPDREGACRRLIDLANARGGRDNITVVILEV